jgi:uncharacterized membrane protein YbhN (UPF0104 family)
VISNQDMRLEHESTGVPRSARRHAMAALRLVVTVGLLWFLAAKIDISRAGELISHAPATLLVAAVATLAATTPINALRWRALLPPGPPLPTAFTLFKILLVGIFFNQVLPSGIGGDAVRAWRCRRLGIGLGVAVRSIMLERASGYAVFVALYAAGLPTLLHAIGDVQQRWAVLLVLAASVAGLVTLLILDKLPRAVVRLPVIAWLAALSVAARQFCSDPRRLVPNLILSASSVGLTVLGYKLVGDGVGATLGFATWLVVIPPVTLIQLVPISVAGWGVREAALVALLGAFGVQPAAALATSVLFGLCQIAVALAGGLVWLGGWDMASPGGEARPAADATTAVAASQRSLRSIAGPLDRPLPDNPAAIVVDG